MFKKMIVVLFIAFILSPIIPFKRTHGIFVLNTSFSDYIEYNDVYGPDDNEPDILFMSNMWRLNRLIDDIQLQLEFN